MKLLVVVGACMHMATWQLGQAAPAELIYEQMRQAPHEPGVLERNWRAPPAAARIDVGGAPRPRFPPPPPPPPPGVHFASVFSSNAVLQRAPARAALYGVVWPPPASFKIMVTLVPAIDGKTAFAADVVGNGTWKVLLPPAPAGGNFSASASCTSCTNTTGPTLYNLTFGDVWFCSGQRPGLAAFRGGAPGAGAGAKRALVLVSLCGETECVDAGPG